MSEFDKNKGTTITQILHIVKISSLFFSAVAFFQYYFNQKTLLLTYNDGLIFFAFDCAFIGLHSMELFTKQTFKT